MQECVSEYISFITSEYPHSHTHTHMCTSNVCVFVLLSVVCVCVCMCVVCVYVCEYAYHSFTSLLHRACDRCVHEKRKTITGDDLLYAMATLGFDHYIEPLQFYLQAYREVSVGVSEVSLALEL